MKSTSGQYFVALDHVRALATFTVFTWHFNYINNGHYGPPPIFPLSFFTEGHVGVALFMTLSGYLFAKLLDRREIRYWPFLWNRFLRLFPLLFLVIALVGVQTVLAQEDFMSYVKSIAAGIVMPTLPNGGWSITAEFHFYILLPILLILGRYSNLFLVAVILIFITLRVMIYSHLGQIHFLAYYTIIGCIDQFIFGILGFSLRSHVTKRHILVMTVIALFLVFFWVFDSLGGFYANVAFPSPSPIWIFYPTVVGLTFAVAIAWYDTSFRHSSGWLSNRIAMIGTYSYSIYLTHFFVVGEMAEFTNTYIVNLSNILLVMLASFASFLLMIPIGYFSYKYIEAPFLRLRTQYIVKERNSSISNASVV